MPKGTGQMFIVMIFMMIMLFAFLNPAVRSSVVGGTNTVLSPLIGFGGHFPTITIMIAELIVVFLGTTLRIFYTDFVQQAKIQNTLKALRLKQREAFKTKDQAKIKELQKVQSSYMIQNTQLMNKQFKVLPVTMIVIFPLFAWLSEFLLSLPYPVFSVPWASSVYFGKTIIFFPAWVFLYGFLGIPFTIMYQRILRYFILRKRLDAMKGAVPARGL